MARVLKVSTQDSVACGAASVEVLAANSQRKYALLTNGSDVTLWIAFGAAAVIGEGVGLPAGAAYEIDETNLWVGAVNAIAASGASKTMGVQEFS